MGAMGTSGYGSAYGGAGAYGSGGYGSSYGGGYGSSYGGGYGNSYGGYGGGYGGSYGGGYGSSLGGYGSRYGSALGSYGSSRYGSRYGGGYGGYGGGYGGYGGGYGAMGVGGYGGAYGGRYGGGPRMGGEWGDTKLDEEGYPIVESGGATNWLMDMENVVAGIGQFTELLDYNFDALHGSFASVLRLFDSMRLLRHYLADSIKVFAVFAIFRKFWYRIYCILCRAMGRSAPEAYEPSARAMDKQWDADFGPVDGVDPRMHLPKRRSGAAKAVLLLVGLLGVLLAGPAVYRLIRGPRRQRKIPPPSELPSARALHDFAGESPEHLPFRKGDIISIIQVLGPDWLKGQLNGKVGLVPQNYVQPIPRQPPTGPPPGPYGSRSVMSR